MTYTIRNEKSGEVIANGLTVEEVEIWWQSNEERYFGVRLVGDVIEVEAV